MFQSHARTNREPGAVSLYHVEVDTLAELAALRERLVAAEAFTGAGDHGSTKAVYGCDPDGIEFELCRPVLDELVEQALAPCIPPTAALDLAAEIERYGASTLGGPRTDSTVWQCVAARHTSGS
ncbi:VOC family protein [Nocardia elegans]|uniref:VOC family protein n=1 Tax=Nocardia elegans TaxID=300029 RepID=UPI002B4B679E|nr:hypothetical protein [Nocardia elegans]